MRTIDQKQRYLRFLGDDGGRDEEFYDFDSHGAQFLWTYVHRDTPALKRLRPKGWTFRVGRTEYPELWIRYYAVARHRLSCYISCSEYANRATGIKLAYVKNPRQDTQLLWANALILKGHKQHKPKTERTA